MFGSLHGSSLQELGRIEEAIQVSLEAINPYLKKNGLYGFSSLLGKPTEHQCILILQALGKCYFQLQNAAESRKYFDIAVKFARDSMKMSPTKSRTEDLIATLTLIGKYGSY